MKIVTLLSGGLDSTTLAYYLREVYTRSYGGDVQVKPEIIALSFDYGQRHKKKELRAAFEIAQLMQVEHHIINLSVEDREHPLGNGPLGVLLSGSALTDESVPVPDGHYAEESMKATIVPNRNAIMLSIAYGVAVARGAELVAFAAHAGDHAIYPDCRPDFVDALEAALRLGNSWASPLPEISGPFLNRTKSEIAQFAVQLGVPIKQTWSCYKGGEIHCGTCGTCVERREAMKLASAQLGYEYNLDPTDYLDSTTEFAAPV